MENPIWSERYRPQTINDCILPDNLKATFHHFVKTGESPNLLLSGGSGVGKTTVARAMLTELGCDSIVINASLYGGIDTLRNDIMRFASTVSLNEGRKYVILDEADYLNAQSTQPALRNFMEQYSANCGFILTCNYPNKIIDALRSRCTEIAFKIAEKDRPSMAAAFFRRMCVILNEEGVTYDKKVVAAIVEKNFPDWRKTINNFQKYSANTKKTIDTGILIDLQQVSFGQLINWLKERDFNATRKWVAENVDIDSSTLFRALYDNASNVMKPESVPQLVLTLGKYQYQHGFCADPEINVAACMAEIMMECHFK